MRTTMIAGSLLLVAWMGGGASDFAAAESAFAAAESAPNAAPLTASQDGEALLKDFKKLYRKFK
ncbi:MAG: hypothetical protein ACYTF3_13535, partial [Planctomycetota bacterium]